MRGTHRFFLTSRSLYLLVLEDRRQDDKSSLIEWLNTIKNRGANSPILVVINKSDQGKEDFSLTENTIQKQYPEVVGLLRTSCNDDDWARNSIQKLREKIVYVIEKDERLKHVRDPIAETWLNIKTKVSSLAEKERVLPLEKYKRLCKEFKKPVKEEKEQTILLRLLHDLGVIVAHGLEQGASAATKDINLLDPNWLTEAIYKVLNHPTVRDQKGEFERKQLIDWLDADTYPEQRHEFILSMMQDEEVSLCFKLLKNNKEERYLIPAALPVNPPDYDDIWPADSLRFRYKYNTFPPGLIPRFIVEAHRNLTAKKTLWRKGAVFAAESCKILVEVDDMKSSPLVDIKVTGPQQRRRSALAVISNYLIQVHKLNPKCDAAARVPLPDMPEVDVSYAHLVKLEDKYSSSYRLEPEGANRDYSVAELLDGVRILESQKADSDQARPTTNPNKAKVHQRSWISISAIVALIAAAICLVLLWLASVGWQLMTACTLVVGLVVFGVTLWWNPDFVFRRWLATLIIPSTPHIIGLSGSYNISETLILEYKRPDAVSVLAGVIVFLGIVFLEAYRMRQENLNKQS